MTRWCPDRQRVMTSALCASSVRLLRIAIAPLDDVVVPSIRFTPTLLVNRERSSPTAAVRLDVLRHAVLEVPEE
jgi:hypothetical protein